MLAPLVRTPNDFALFLVRVGLGIVILPHGLQKLFGWFGGKGVAGTIHFFEEALKIPPFWTACAIAAETAGALALIVGFLGRVGAAGVLVVMGVAVYLIHGRQGFFMNWYAQPRGEGYEFHILAIAMGLAVLIRGSGAFSVDRALTKE
ncbi:MAG TPA: DoxX family protein [Acidobacteriota bacterium]|nr:DoxX family protein [Acidobacteriota bacterium]